MMDSVAVDGLGKGEGFEGGVLGLAAVQSSSVAVREESEYEQVICHDQKMSGCQYIGVPQCMCVVLVEKKGRGIYIFEFHSRD